MRARRLVLTGVVAAASAVATLQDVAARQLPAFEVVSIRPTKSSLESGFVLPDQLQINGNRLYATFITAAALVRKAYGPEFATRDQVIGGDAWVQSDRFDVDARAASILSEAPTSTLSPTAAQMLQRVLQERFQLRVHRETRPLQRYALTYARTDRALGRGIRLSAPDCTSKPFNSAGCEYRPGPGKYVMRGRPIQDLVDFLSRPAYTARPVFDDTGIKGTVDIDLDWVMDFGDIMASNANLLANIQSQLGLKLESRDVPMPVLVIDSIQRPSAN